MRTLLYFTLLPAFCKMVFSRNPDPDRYQAKEQAQTHHTYSGLNKLERLKVYFKF